MLLILHSLKFVGFFLAFSSSLNFYLSALQKVLSCKLSRQSSRSDKIKKIDTILFDYPLSKTEVNVPVGNYMFKVSNRNTRTRWEICSKLTIKTPKRIVNFEHVSHLVLVFLLLTLSR